MMNTFRRILTLLFGSFFTMTGALAGITALENEKGWIIETAGSHYVIAVTDEAAVLNSWWGPKLAHTDYDLRPLHLPPFSDGAARQEYAAWGGMYYSEPSLKVRFADANRDLKLRYERSTVSTKELIIQLRDEHYPLEVRLHYRIVESEDLIERWAEVRNTGTEAIRLEDVGSALLHLPRRDRWRLRYLAGRYAAETQVHEIDLNQGKFQVESRRGASSHQFNPWFALSQPGSATEDQGEVWFGQLAWSGSWKIGAELNSIGQLQVYGGIHDFDFEWKLAGGETFTTPKFIGGFSKEGFGGASRRLARYQLDQVLPPRYAKEVRPVIFNSWYATELDVNVEQQIRLAEQAAKLGAELFVVDDGWFSGRTDDFGGLGDWSPDTNKFPNGLKPLIDRVQRAGMKFGLWIEPEMVNRKSKLFEKHPDWVFAFPHRKGSEQRNQLMLNFSKPEVVEHLFGVMDRLLTGNEIAFVKWDMNRHISEPGWTDGPPDQQKEIWVRHVRGVYQLVDRLRAKHPHVLWENCSGGGGRADLGMLERMDQTWVSDNTDPLDRLRIQFGYTHAFAAKTMVAWVTDNPDGINKRSTPLAFKFHVASTGTLGIGGNLLRWTDAEMEEAKFHVAQYKSVRELVQHGDLYRIGSPEKGACGFHFVNRDQKNSAAYFFQVATEFGEEPVFQLPGLKPTEKYNIALAATKPGEKDRPLATLTGDALAHRGLKLPLKGTFKSALLKIKLLE
ncbi:MAG: alpha-galactosidase [Limisphaerales bacterium]